MVSDVPGLRGLARRIASGELQGPAAFDAVVALITAAEARSGWTEQQIAQLRDEVVLGVSHDRELCALLFEHRAEDGVLERDAVDVLRDATKRRGDKGGARRINEEAPERRGAEEEAEAVRRDAARAAEKRRADEARRAAADASRRSRLPKAPAKGRAREAEDDLGELGRPQLRSRLIGVGALLAVVGGGLAFWWLTQSGPCDRLIKDICLDAATKTCEPAAFGDALAEGGIDDARCEETIRAIETALEGVESSRRSRVWNATLLESLGFDPRGDEAPPPPPTAEEEEAAKGMKPVPVVRDQTGITSLFIDSSHLYWTRGDPAGVLRTRSIGGTAELVGATPDPIDVTATRDYVYWVSRAGPAAQVWVDPKRGNHEPAPLLTPGFLPQRAAFLGADYVFVDATTGAVLIADVSGGAPRKVTEGGVPAPTLLGGDAKTAYWITPAPVGTLSAAPLDGSAPASVVASGLADPRALLVDGSGVYWLEGSTGSVMRWKPGATTIDTLATKQANPIDLALDDDRVYWTNAGGGMVMAMPKAGGEAVAVATGQPALSHVVVDGAAVYWVSGSDVMRVPK